MKQARKSKTISLNVLGMLGLFVPHLNEWIARHPKELLAGVLGINILLRFFTHDKVQIGLPGVLKKMTRFYNVLIICAAAACMLGASRCANIPMDRSVSAAEGNDYVVVLSGAGQHSTKGYLFAQVNEKTAVNGVYTLTFPATSCTRDSCIRYQFFRKDGSAGYAGAIPKGQTLAQVRLSDIVGHDGQVMRSDDGEYTLVAQVFYQGADGQEYSMIGNGFIRVNVLSELYRPVACGDPNIAWKVKTPDNCEAQYTTVFRSTVCGEACQ